MNKVYNPLLVDTKIIGNLHFQNKEVFGSPELKQNVEFDASLHSNKVRIKILFEDSEALRKVRTNVWAVTKHHVVLNNSATIPVKRIHEIKI